MLSSSTIGMLLYLSGMFCCVVLNIFMKISMTKFNLPTSEALFIRQAIIVFCFIPLMVKKKFNFFNKESLKPNLIRNSLFALSTLLLYTGISKVPLNDATAISFLTPIIGSVFAVKILKEKSSKFLWIALFLSIIGVFVIKKPGFNDEDILLGYGVLLLAMFIRGYIVILNKRLTNKFDVFTMLFYTHIIMFLMYLLFFKQFKPIPLDCFKYIIGASFLFFCEYFLIFSAYKKCSAISLQPLEFSRLLFMMVLSYLILNEQVSTNQIIGGFIIVSGFILVIIDKRRKAKIG